jgi:hypothetical protein
MEGTLMKWAFIFLAWYGTDTTGQPMNYEFETEAQCNAKRPEIEEILRREGEEANGKFFWYVGECFELPDE